MKFCDLCGPPGSGKSTLADPLWGPHAVPDQNHSLPAEWGEFTGEITRLFSLIRDHRTIEAALRMNRRSLIKMATVYREPVAAGSTMQYKDRPLPTVYIQTGLVQRGLGFGWRLNDMGKDLNELRPFFRLMPVSLGVAVVRCPLSIVEERNHARKLIPKTAHEDRAFMVPLMQPAIELAIEVLKERGVTLCEIDTTQPVEEARRRLFDFVEETTYRIEPATYSGNSLFPLPHWME